MIGGLERVTIVHQCLEIGGNPDLEYLVGIEKAGPGLRWFGWGLAQRKAGKQQDRGKPGDEGARAHGSLPISEALCP